jgi:hypothetical protein
MPAGPVSIIGLAARLRLTHYCHLPLLLPVIRHHFANKHRGVKVKLIGITSGRIGIDVDIAGSCPFFAAYRRQHLAGLAVKQILLKILVSLVQVGIPDGQLNVATIRFRLVVRQLIFLQRIGDSGILQNLLAELSALRSQIKNLGSSRTAKRGRIHR